MTTAHVWAALRRRWPLVVIGLIVTVGACIGVALQPGMYWTRVTVVLLPPRAEFRPNNIQDSEESMAMVASLVALDVNGGPAGQRLASPEAPLYGEGLAEATRVRVRDTGGQWMSAIQHPYIDLEVVSASPQVVGQELARLRGELDVSLTRLQDAQRISPAMRASLQYSPEDTGVVHIRPARTRALAATALAGGAATLAGVLLWDGAAARRRQA